MGSFNSLPLPVLEIRAFKVPKSGQLFSKVSPYEISKSGDKISDFWVFRVGF